jgi:hypothetical protein
MLHASMTSIAGDASTSRSCTGDGFVAIVSNACVPVAGS